tara:strand:+ start:2854 stop:3192 length:339 start_codon:yes stop_codon:yes gene_type:complete
MKAIERAKAHFDAQEIKVTKVPEWGDDEGNPLLIYSKPLTLAEMSKLQRYAKEDDVALMAYCLIHRSLDSEGEKLFTLDDKHTLMNSVDRDVLQRVAAELMSSSSYEDELKK